MNLEFTDILSLEPVDNVLRPLRVNPHLWRNEWDYDEDEEELPSDYFRYLKPKIL